MTRLLLLLVLLLVLLAPVTAQAGVAEQSLTHANAEVRTAVLHDVCEVHGNDKRDQLDRRGPRGVRLDPQGAATFTRCKRRPGDGDADILRVRACPAKAVGANQRSPCGLIEGAVLAHHRHRHCHQRMAYLFLISPSCSTPHSSP
jgi:hypothetical protein